MTTPLIKETFEKAEGIFQLMPGFVPRLCGEADFPSTAFWYQKDPHTNPSRNYRVGKIIFLLRKASGSTIRHQDLRYRLPSEYRFRCHSSGFDHESAPD